MTFFYDLNKKLSDLADKQTLNEDMSRAAKGYEKYGKEGMQALAKAGREGKALDPVRKKHDKYDEGIIGTGIGAGLGALALGPLGAVGGAIAGDKIGDAFDEDMSDVVKKIGSGVKKVGRKALDTLGHGSDEDMIRDLQRKAGLPQTGKKPTGARPTGHPMDEGDMEEGNEFSGALQKAKATGQKEFEVDGKEYPVKEAAKYRDPKYKDKLYTQEPPDYTYGPDMDDAYYNPKPDDYAGRKRKIGGSEFDHNDPLRRGDGIGRSGIKNNILDRGPRKGMPSRDQITSLKGSIKSAKGTHARPNLPEADAPMTSKQKSFAALAEPRDKITFADKIAGAKKEVDEMLGDVAAEAMKKALGGGMGRSAEMEEKEDLSPFTNYKKPRADKPKVGSVERGALHDIEHTATGRKVTRRVDPNTGHSVGTDDTPAAGDKRGKGRPKGTGKSIGAKGPSGKSKLMTKEGSDSGQAQEIYNELAELRAIAKKAQGGGQMPPGFASRLESSLWAAMTMIKNQQPGNAQVSEEELDEKATSKKQQKFMGMVHAAQKGKKPASKEVGKVAKTMKKKDAEDFASTKHKGLPEKKAKKKDETVEETTDSKQGKSGMQYGKGVYETKLAESFNAKMSQMLNESMNINASTDSEGHNSITVSATDEDAGKLAQILKLAGMGGGSDGYSEVCPACGSRECGCNQVDEELANSADNTEYAGIDTMTKTLSGGLNGPKTTGQTTAPVVNRDPARGSVGPVAESQEARLWELYQRYSAK
jgi:hypothetical protein